MLNFLKRVSSGIIERSSQRFFWSLYSFRYLHLQPKIYLFCTKRTKQEYDPKQFYICKIFKKHQNFPLLPNVSNDFSNRWEDDEVKTVFKLSLTRSWAITVFAKNLKMPSSSSTCVSDTRYTWDRIVHCESNSQSSTPIIKEIPRKPEFIFIMNREIV